MAGELVGEAWVAIHARDGGMTGDIRKLTKEAAEEYSEGLDSEIQKQTEARFARDKSIMARILAFDDDKAIDDAIKRWGAPEKIEEAFQRMAQHIPDKRVFQRLNADFDDAMDRIYGRMQDIDMDAQTKLIEDQEKAWVSYGRNVQATAQRMKLEEQEKLFGRVRLQMEKLSTELNRKHDGDLLKVMARGDWKQFTRNFADMDKAADGLSDSLIRLGRADTSLLVDDVNRLTASFQDFRREQERMELEKKWEGYAAKLSREFEKSRLDIEDYASAVEDARRRTDRALDRKIATAGLTGDWSALAKEMDNSRFITGRVKDRLDELTATGKIHRDQVRRIHLEYNEWRRAGVKLGDAFNNFPDRIGRMFGKGSRNNLLNFVGSTLSNLTSLAVAVPKLGFKIGQGISDMVRDFRALRAGGAGLATALTRSLIPALAGAAPLLASMAAGGALLVKLIPGIAAAISSLTGIATAWVSVLSNAMSGFLVPLVPLLVAVGGGATAFGFAVDAMLDKVKTASREGEKLSGHLGRMQEAHEGLTKSFERFTDRVAPQVVSFWTLLADATSSFFDAVAPGVQSGMDRFANILRGESLEGPLQSWRDSLSPIFSDFAAGLAQMSAGLVKFFEPILPYAERLSTAFYEMMFNFNVWAGSGEGKNSIATWMERAWTAASTLWDTITNIGSALGQIFSIGTDEAGQSFLSSLEGMTAEFEAWTKSEQGRKDIAQWFQDAKEVGETLWEIIGDIATAFDELDTTEAREDLNTFLTSVGSVTTAFEDVATAITTTSDLIDEFFARTSSSSGNTGADMGAALGLGPANAESIADRFSHNLGERLARNLVGGVFGEGVVRAIDEADIAIAKAIDSWLAPNEETQNFFRRTFAVDGETWGEITGQMWEDFKRGIDTVFLAEGEGGEWMRTKLGNLFMLPEATWAEIGTQVWTDFTNGLSAIFSAGEGENETTKDFVRRLFTVEGDTWAEIGSDIWSGFTQGLVDGFNEQVREPFNRFIEDVRQLLGIASPSTVFMEIGGYVIQGLIQGMIEAVTAIPGLFAGWITQWTTQLGTFFLALPGQVFVWLSSLGTQLMANFITAGGQLGTWMATTGLQLGMWFMALPGRIFTWLSGLAGQLMSNFLTAGAQVSVWLMTKGTELRNWFVELPGKVGTWLGDLGRSMAAPFVSAWNDVNNALSSISTMVGGWLETLREKVRSISSVVSIGRNDSRFGMPDVPFLARGALVGGPTLAMVGEAGREAVIPLDRPLSQIDPSVRGMAATLRGHGGGGNVFEPGSIILQYAGQDPYRAAEAFLDDLALQLP